MRRLPTGSAELDLVLDGGLPAGSLVVLAGGPGTGKTILAQQICFANATPEHPAIFYTTFAEPHAKLIRYLEPFDFFDAGALAERVEFVNLESLLVDEAGRDGDALGPALTELVRACFERQPSLVVLDSAKALRDFADEQAVRRLFYDLSGRVAHTETVLLFLGEYAPAEIESGPEFSLADGILQLAYEQHEPLDRRWLRVVKLRGSDHLGGKHSVTIDHTGVVVSPRLESLRPPDVPAERGRLSTGIPGLDEMTGGGIPAGDLTAFLGPSGSGKTIAALRFVVQGLEQGESCLYVSFQEDAEQLVEKVASFGWQLAPALESGQLQIYCVPQGILDLDVLGAAVRAGLASGKVRRVAIDSLAELVFSAGEAARFPAYARMLSGFIRAAGATAVITSEVATLGPMTEPLGGLSFLFHNVVLLRYVEIDSQLRRAASVLKMRDSDHEEGVRQFEIGEQGLVVGDRLEGLTGLLGWSALREGPPPAG
ncbi:MAG TPA: ATPase domain-containing protein [Gaiellaceae bacterium]|nr:ATPase domain-containing protein [Gaiellaceae bacterium]